MLLKKSSLALCSSGSLSSGLSLPATASITSSPSLSSTTPSPTSTFRPRKKARTLPKPWLATCSYATVQNGSRPPDSHQPQTPRSSARNPSSSPPTWPTTTHPTPYDIFAQSRTAPYSKTTFYQLVKLYHPDRHPHSSPTLSHATKLDRYRLVVAANTILSNPAKRRAYDLYGTGWARPYELNSPESFREADRAWRSEPWSAAGNATWEDWERWRHRNAGTSEPQSPLYMSNGLFVGVLALFVVVGGWGQATRAGNHSVHLIEMREKSSQTISEEMWQRRKEKAMLGREERIEAFLKSREGWDTESHEDHVPED